MEPQPAVEALMLRGKQQPTKDVLLAVGGTLRGLGGEERADEEAFALVGELLGLLLAGVLGASKAGEVTGRLVGRGEIEPRESCSCASAARSLACLFSSSASSTARWEARGTSPPSTTCSMFEPPVRRAFAMLAAWCAPPASTLRVFN